MGRFLRPCLDCGELTRNSSRCDKHQKRIDDLMNARRAAVKKDTGQYSGDYKRRAKAVRDNATVCHLCGEGARHNDPWQADHLIPADPDSPLAAAHASCNRQRGNKPLS
jgi:hypothetical protein